MKVDENKPCSKLTESEAEAANLCNWSVVIEFTNIAAYNAGLWLFAFEYWCLSHMLLNGYHNRITAKLKRRLSLVKWSVLGILIAIGFSFCVCQFYILTNGPISIVPSVMWIVSFFFLLDGLCRIHKIMKEVADAVIIFKMFIFYGATAFLAILGQIPVIILHSLNQVRPKANAVVTIINNVIIFVF